MLVIWRRCLPDLLCVYFVLVFVLTSRSSSLFVTKSNKTVRVKWFGSSQPKENPFQGDKEVPFPGGYTMSLEGDEVVDNALSRV